MNQANTLCSTDCVVDEPLAPQVHRVGQERVPVITIDDFLFEVDTLRRFARDRARFSGDGKTSYPGVRSVLPEDYSRKVIELLEPLIRSVYGIPLDYQALCTHQVFSLITTPAAKLGVLQRVPHFDTRRPYYFALMHYLNPGDFGGTGFFRHRPSGYERISDANFAHFVASAERHMAKQGVPSPNYCRGSDDHFELIHQVAYRPNRLLIYPGNLLHSALVHPDSDINSDPASGRLTANIFLDFSAL